jgi:hypothetical protein
VRSRGRPRSGLRLGPVARPRRRGADGAAGNRLVGLPAARRHPGEGGPRGRPAREGQRSGRHPVDGPLSPLRERDRRRGPRRLGGHPRQRGAEAEHPGPAGRLRPGRREPPAARPSVSRRRTAARRDLAGPRRRLGHARLRRGEADAREHPRRGQGQRGLGRDHSRRRRARPPARVVSCVGRLARGGPSGMDGAGHAEPGGAGALPGQAAPLPHRATGPHGAVDARLVPGPVRDSDPEELRRDVLGLAGLRSEARRPGLGRRARSGRSRLARRGVPAERLGSAVPGSAGRRLALVPAPGERPARAERSREARPGRVGRPVRPAGSHAQPLVRRPGGPADRLALACGLPEGARHPHRLVVPADPGPSPPGRAVGHRGGPGRPSPAPSGRTPSMRSLRACRASTGWPFAGRTALSRTAR